MYKYFFQWFFNKLKKKKKRTNKNRCTERHAIHILFQHHIFGTLFIPKLVSVSIFSQFFPDILYRNQIYTIYLFYSK